MSHEPPQYMRHHLEQHGAELVEELIEREAIVSGGVGPERWRVAYEIVCRVHSIRPQVEQRDLFGGAAGAG